MRDIKFRAQLKTDLKWIFWELFDAFHAGSEKEWFVLESVGQYTGLKDKNGTEIYEGDIVQWHYGNNTEQRVVEWVVDQAMFKPNDLDQDPPVEVIGNIYENPELIK